MIATGEAKTSAKAANWVQSVLYSWVASANNPT
jgi:hypothetical protein